MYDLFYLIRSKVLAQSLHLPKKATFSRTRQEILSRSWWIYSDHDFQSRISNQTRSPKRRLIQDGAMTIPINGVRRIISQSTFQFLLSGFRREIEMNEIIKFIKDEESTTLLKISKALDLQIKVVEKSISKALKSWNVIKYKDNLYYWEKFVHKKNLFHFESDELKFNEDLVSTILDRYPFLTVNQLAMLSGYTKSQVENHIYEIVQNSSISRGIMRNDSNEEYFSISQKNLVIDIIWEETAPFVLEKRDALVEVIRLERNFKFTEANWWFFLDGIPQAQFNLTREGKSNHYIVSGFNRLLKTKRDLTEIELGIKEWGRTNHLSLSIDFTESPYANLTKKLIGSLENRGYIFQNGGLSLQLDRKQPSSYNPFSTKKMKTWYLDKQMFGSVLSAGEVLHELIQLDNFKSIIVRLRTEKSKIDFTNIIYTSGVNYRLGFVHKDILPIIIRGWPREARLNHIDRLITKLLQHDPHSTSQILAKINQPRNKILARIRYLEQVRAIHRDLSKGFITQSPTWKILGLESNFTSLKSLSDIGKIFQQILSNHPPLTISQLSRYLGLSFLEINQIKQELIKSDQIIEGYFFDLYQEIQMSTPSVINNLQEIMKNYKQKKDDEDFIEQEICLIPQSDPLAILHMSYLILGNKSLEIKTRIDPKSEIWMIMWNSSPSGYVLKIPTSRPSIDFEIEIRIVPDLAEISILSLIIDNLSFLNQFWNNSNLYLTRINNFSLSERKFEQLHFILDSMGIQYQLN
ncbi:MAG: hypothetical protein HeimC2_06160 [Candidatus Heimdallarchaeota archaeon LC_2]|nr:MAG: hypothetical protein HeimC2_06160 [Candidatus Heimdallarchaeota archaeon LC_2]